MKNAIKKFKWWMKNHGQCKCCMVCRHFERCYEDNRHLIGKGG